MKYRWSVSAPQPELTNSLAQQFQICPLLAQCLINRGLVEPERIARFLEPRLRHLADPFLIPNMDAAVDRMLRAREEQESIVVFGDYDVDGVTATALLVEVLTALGWSVNYYLPHRIDEGYGLTQTAVENCLKKFPTKLLLAVDCGSKTGPANDWLASRGVDVVVLDHHQVSSPPPKVTALVNPQLGEPEAPSFRELCSVGIAFKFAHAVVKRFRNEAADGDVRGPGAGAEKIDLREWLDLVALGTIADLVPLTGENRIFVSAGLARLTETQRPGLIALKNVAQLTGAIGGYEVGFQLAPRLNAAGRLETALDALGLLLTRDPAEAEALAKRLDTQNRQRQAIEQEIVDAVLASLRQRFSSESDFVIVEAEPGWHIGVVGIVASRVVQEFYRPTIVFGGDGEHLRGSGRSIEGFNLAAALEQCGKLLLRHGGHSMAAGLAIEPAKVEAFREHFNDLARTSLKPEQLQPALRLDAEIAIGELTWQLLKDLERLRETGIGNPAVQLLARNLKHRRPPERVGADKQHAKFWATDGTATKEVIWWGVGDKALPEDGFELAFTPQLNEFNGTFGIQLKLLDWRKSQTG